MIPWKDFLRGWIGKIQKHKEERDRSGKLKKKNMKERVDERKRRDFDGHGGSHTHVFSVGPECPWATTLVQPSLRRTYLYGNSYTNKQVCPSSV
jgi:hypothetical protein